MHNQSLVLVFGRRAQARASGSISPETPTVAVIPRGDLYPKNLSTIEEIRARRGPVFTVTHTGAVPATVEAAFEVPASEPELAPILLSIPLQLLAYHLALKKGCDIDKPRNLAKSVTVEWSARFSHAGRFSRVWDLGKSRWDKHLY